MSETLATPINCFSADNALPCPKELHHCGRRLGILSSIRQDEDCQIARIVNRFGEHLIVLPQDLDLSGYIGLGIVLVRIGDKYRIRMLS